MLFNWKHHDWQPSPLKKHIMLVRSLAAAATKRTRLEPCNGTLEELLGPFFYELTMLVMLLNWHETLRDSVLILASSATSTLSTHCNHEQNANYCLPHS